MNELIVHPVTGEANELATMDVAEIRDGIEQLAEMATRVREAQAQLAAEVWRRKNQGEPTPGVDVSQSRTWNVGETAAALERLIADGDIPASCGEFVYPVESKKADTRSLNRLADTLVAEGKLDAARTLLSARRESIKAKVKA